MATSADVTTLKVGVDTTTVRTGAKDLDQFAASGQKAETAATGLERAGKSAADGLAATGKSAAQALQSVTPLAAAAEAVARAESKNQAAQAASVQASLRLKSAQEALQRIYEAGPPTQDAIAAATARVQAAQAGVAQATARAATAQQGLQRANQAYADSLNRTGAQSRLTANQTAQLSAQLQDLFVQIQAGGNPLTALIQQGSQLSAVFGGIGPALSAVASLFTITRVAALGLAGTVGALAIGFATGAEQSAALQRSLLLTGNAAGLTEDRFNALSEAVAESTRSTIGSTRETLQSLVASGRFSGEVLGQAATATQLLAKVTGQSTDDIVKSFADATDAPTRFAQSLNRTYNFLSAAQVEQVRQLEEQGRASEALLLIFGQLNPRLQQAAGVTTDLSSAWSAVKREVSAAADALSSIGRDRTPEDRLREISANIAELQRAGRTRYVFGPTIAELEAQRTALRDQVVQQQKLAEQGAARAKQEQAAVVFQGLLNGAKGRQQQFEEAIAAARAKGEAAGASAAEINQVTAALARQFGIVAQARELQEIGQQSAAQAIARQLQTVAAAFQNANVELEAQRAAVLLSDRAYYEAKAALIRGAAQAEISAQEALIRQEQSRRIIAENGIEADKQRAEIGDRIAASEARIAIVRADTAAKLSVLSTQQDEALRRQRTALTETQIAAELYVEALRRAGDVRVAGIGRGDRERQRQEDLAAIQERFQRERENLDAQLSAGALRGKREEYEQRLRILDKAQRDEEEIYRRTFDRITEAQGDWLNGARRAFENYRDAAGDAATQSERFFEQALDRGEDALADWLAAGEFSLSAFADFARRELARALARDIISGATGNDNSFAALLRIGANYIGGLFTQDAGINAPDNNGIRGGRAQGGTVERGGIYPINELGGPGEILEANGRQYLLAAANGRVDPNTGGGAQPMVVNNYFNLSGPVDRRSQQQIAASAGEGVRRAMARNT